MWRYLKSREFWFTILGLVLLGGATYVLFFFVFLPNYTNHGESVLVPEVTELALDDAEGKLDEIGLRYEVVDSHYKSGLPPMTILAQDPLGFSKVKPGRRIYLTVNKVLPPMVTLPDVEGVSQYQAKLRLEGANLVIEKMEYVPHQYKNLVLAAFFKGKRLSEGDTLPKYSKIVLRVGKGQGEQRVDIPELVGENYQTAIGMLHRAGLNVGVIRFLPDAPEEDYTVTRQNPKFIPGDSIKLGSEVDLFISGKEPEEGLEEMIFGIESDSEQEDADGSGGTAKEKVSRSRTEGRSPTLDMSLPTDTSSKADVPASRGSD
ncbi:MAG: PASTA domain-containing protein [Bacteroidota bacterium]